uniref:Transcriptional repressor CTCF-like n=1 Tax=Stegastes partitus TaxID=144197 RepID=A0A3B5BDF4_9TELE
MSKSDILRGIITEKLSTAAREILAVVERTVTDYEEEASGFRRELDRQRRQLELLQPQVQLERRGQGPPGCVQHVDGTGVDAVTSTSQRHQDLEIKEDAAEDEVDSSVDRDCEEDLHGDDEWNPDSELQLPKPSRKPRPKTGPSKILKIHGRKSKSPCRVNHQKTFDCSQCGKPKLHTGRDKYICNICGLSLYDLSLNLHVRTHTNEKPFVCIVCSKGFVANGELKSHMRVHTGEAPYGCSECGRFFKRKNTLDCHVRSHLGIKRLIHSLNYHLFVVLQANSII